LKFIARDMRGLYHARRRAVERRNRPNAARLRAKRGAAGVRAGEHRRQRGRLIARLRAMRGTSGPH
jgi:hypothetical protein